MRIVILLFLLVLVQASDKILLSDVKSLVFNRDVMTVGRRLDPIPQLNCVTGSNLFKPDIVTCENIGVNAAGMVQWRCEKKINKKYKLGKITVS